MPSKEPDYATLKKQTKAGRLLWHYTTWKGLDGILGNIADKKLPTLRATDSQYLNDSRELTHALDRFWRIAKGLGCKATQIDALRDSVVNRASAYVASLAGAFDDLSMWRAYAESHLGFAVGFRRERIESISEQQHFRLLKCSYTREKFDAADDADVKAIRAMLGAAANWLTDPKKSVDQWMNARAAGDDFAKALAARMLTVAPRYKDPAFIQEREWRLVRVTPAYWGQEPSSDGVKFRQVGAMIAPYVEINLAPDHTPPWSQQKRQGREVASGNEPIAAILVGPNSFPVKNAASIRRRVAELEAYGAVPPVIRSAASFRTRY